MNQVAKTLLLLSLLCSLSGFNYADKQYPGVNNCPTELDFEELYCPGPDAQRVAPFNNLLAQCYDGQNLNLSLATRRSCLGALLHAFRSLETSTCKTTYVDRTRCVLKHNIISEIPALIRSDIPAKIEPDGLNRFLKDLSQWHTQTSISIYADNALSQVKLSQIPPDSELSLDVQSALIRQRTLDLDQNDILNAFFIEVFNQSLASTLPQDETKFLNQAAAFFQIINETNRISEMPAPLVLELTGRSLKPISDHVHFLAKVNDLGCRLLSCRLNTNTELFHMIEFLSSLLNFEEVRHLASTASIDSDLRSSLANAAENAKAAIRSLSPVFQKLGVPPFQDKNFGIETLSVLDVPPFLQNFVEIVQRCHLLRNSYRSSGVYIKTDNLYLDAFMPDIKFIERVIENGQTTLNNSWSTFRKNSSRDFKAFESHFQEEFKWLNNRTIPAILLMHGPFFDRDLVFFPSLMNIIEGLRLDSSVTDIIQLISGLYNDLRLHNKLATLKRRGWETGSIILRVPKPEIGEATPLDPYSYKLMPFKKAPLSMRENIWKAFRENTIASISMLPEYLYSKNGEANSLSLSQLSPWIETMGLYFVTEEKLRYSGYSTQIEFDREMKFPMEHSLETYLAPENPIRIYEVPFEAGDPSKWSSVLKSPNVIGLSPFTKLTVDFGKAASIMRENFIETEKIHEILMIFKLRGRASMTDPTTVVPAPLN